MVSLMLLQHAHAACLSPQSSSCRMLNRSMDDMDLLQVVGETHLATVARCRCARSGMEVAAKMYHKERMTALNQRQACMRITGLLLLAESR